MVESSQHKRAEGQKQRGEGEDGGVGRGQEDKMWTEDEMEIQSDKKQERRTKTQSWRVRERANSRRGESREMKEEE